MGTCVSSGGNDVDFVCNKSRIVAKKAAVNVRIGERRSRRMAKGRASKSFN